MADIVNLRQARKDRRRQDKEAAAAENRARFGRPKGAKLRDRQEAELAARQHDGHRRDGDGSKDTGGDGDG